MCNVRFKRLYFWWTLSYRKLKSRKIKTLTSLAKFQISRLLIRHYDWLNFSEYKHNIRIVSRLRNKEDQYWSRYLESSELKTLVLNILNPDCLISASNVDTFDFLLNLLLYSKLSTGSRIYINRAENFRMWNP